MLTACRSALIDMKISFHENISHFGNADIIWNFIIPTYNSGYFMIECRSIRHYKLVEQIYNRPVFLQTPPSPMSIPPPAPVPISTPLPGIEHNCCLNVCSSSSVNDFKNLVMQDAKKEEFCRIHNYPLLVIRYDDMRPYRTIIEEFIRQNNIYI